MPQFLTRLTLRTADTTDDGQWEIVEPLVFVSDVARLTITVPAGFRTDLASVPRIPVAYWLAGGSAAAAAVVHDYLYNSRLVPRKVADEVLREASTATAVPAWRRWLMWSAVRLFGGFYWRDCAEACRAN